MYTVKELIEALQECPQDNVVFCMNIKTGFSCEVASVGNNLVNGTVDIFFEEDVIWGRYYLGVKPNNLVIG